MPFCAVSSDRAQCYGKKLTILIRSGAGMRKNILFQLPKAGQRQTVQRHLASVDFVKTACVSRQKIMEGCKGTYVAFVG